MFPTPRLHQPPMRPIRPIRRVAAFAVLLLAGLGRPLAAQTIYTPYKFVTIAGTTNAGHADGAGSAAGFYLPYMLAVDTGGNVFVSDTDNQTIRKITPSVSNGVTTWTVSTIAGTALSTGYVEGAGATARFSHPLGIAVDTNDNLYVSDSDNGAVRKIVPTVAGGVTTWTVSTLAANLGSLGGIAVDTNGYVYTDTENSPEAILKISPAGVVTSLAGQSGGPGYVNGPGASALFNTPYGLAVDSSGNVIVADAKNRLIRKVTPSGTVSTVAGIYGTPGSADGPVSGAQLGETADVALDSAGNIYTCAVFYANVNFGETIRMITPGGNVTTLGGIPGVSGSADGTGSAARFSEPFGVAVDSKGNVFVADTGNNTIRIGSPPSVAPTFTLAASPSTTTVATGRAAVFNAIATGTPAPSYQWTLNGSPTIPGAAVTTDPILMVSGATTADNGTYTCTATNTGGNATTSATLSVVSSSSPGYLNNVSALGFVGTGGGILIGGFNVIGSGSKEILVRGIGPGLNTTFQLNGYLSNPYAELFLGNNPVMAGGSPVQNDDWGAPDYPGAPIQATVTTAMATLGAYSLPSVSLDAAILTAVPVSGSVGYTVQVSGVGGVTGTGVVEIYDADSGAPSVRLNNLSARNLVETGQNILIGGFSIAGSTDETVLIRAIGPGLNSTFGLTGILAQPVLTLFKGSAVIYSNTVWGGDPVLTAVQATVGAYPLVPSSTDSLLLVTLSPGGYTAQVTGLNATTGIGVVQIYEVY